MNPRLERLRRDLRPGSLSAQVQRVREQREHPTKALTRKQLAAMRTALETLSIEQLEQLAAVEETGDDEDT